MGTDILLAVDGGNSKTDVLLLDDEGREIARRRGPGSGGGAEQLAVVVAALIAEELARGDEDTRITHCIAAVAGLDFDEDVPEYASALQAVLPRAVVRVQNDAAALLGAGEGVAIVYGAGFNAVARGPLGLASHPAIGWPSGEWGGGTALGQEAVGIAYRSSDGRGPRSSLEQSVPTAAGQHDPASLARAIRDGVVDSAAITALAPLLTRAAAHGDEAAAAVVRRAWQEVVALALAVARWAWGGRHPDGTPAVLAGGVLADDAFRDGLLGELSAVGFSPRRLGTDPVERVADAVRGLAGIRTETT
ncbi:MAG TPA: BadF/BadG/BcrA/BcrD ATPase family protein [Naasia sp.]|jgi:N-acetylglucosamine kinase-like BadF-type ATPase